MALRDFTINKLFAKGQGLRLVVSLLVCLSFLGGLQMLLVPSTVEAADNPSVEVRIETPARTIWDGQVDAAGCTITDADGIDHVITGPKAACALDAAATQGGFSYIFLNSAWGLYLTSVDGVASDASNYWLYRVNYISPLVGLADYDLLDGDELLLSFGPWPDIPLGVSSSSTQVEVGEQFTVSSSYYDDSQSIFVPLGDAEVHLGTSILQTDAQGDLTTSLGQPGTYDLYMEKSGYVRSDSLQIEVIKAPVSPAELLQSAQSALDYLRSQQGADGSIENAGVSAWAAIAFGSADIDPDTVENPGLSLVDYLETYVPTPGGSATDYARQILAVLAAGEDPRSFGTDLIAGLEGFHQDGQIGDTGFINDDIFAVLALLGAGEDINQQIIQDSIAYTVAHQNADGGFSYSITGSSDIDTTAAAIQALVLARNEGFSGPPDLDLALTNARAFLAAAQNSDGGFPYSTSGIFSDSNSASTSWAIQALTALGEDVSTWKAEDGSTPFHFLLGSQNADGSFSWTAGGPGQNLMTAYAIPALLGQAWPVTLDAIQCSGEAPALSLYEENVGWASLADYQARTLTVDFSIQNAEGGADADNVQIVGSVDTNGVIVLADFPLSQGFIAAGASTPFSLSYFVPEGTLSYQTTVYATADDICGNHFEYPMPWPGT